MDYYFAPGCALFLYKPHLIEKLHAFLCAEYGAMDALLTCCRHTPPLPDDARVINICPGCDRRYRENYSTPRTVSLWELLSQNEAFPFPDYEGREMTIIDACPTRDQVRVHDAVRNLAEKMNIRIIEPKKTRLASSCCGDTFFEKLPTAKVKELMKKKASEMPRDEILVYCVSCSKSMFVGGKRPGYIVDLLFAEETIPQTVDPDLWHGELDEFIEAHKDFQTRALCD